MLSSLVASQKISVLERALNASTLRHKVISNNIANVNTPGFKKSEVMFEDILNRELESNGKQLSMMRTHNRHLPMTAVQGAQPQVHTITNTSMRTDDNNVDIDIEMAELSKNNIYYNAVVHEVSSYFTGLKSVISGGR